MICPPGIWGKWSRQRKLGETPAAGGAASIAENKVSWREGRKGQRCPRCRWTYCASSSYLRTLIASLEPWPKGRTNWNRDQCGRVLKDLITLKRSND